MGVLRNDLSSLGIFLCLACGGPEPPEPACEALPEPTFELGTGETRFVPLTSGQDLQLVRGPQGECHFPLAFLTRGFSGSRTLVRYRTENLTEQAEIIASRQFVRLQPSGLRADWCENVNFTAFVVEPQNVEDDPVRIEVTIEEEARTDTQTVDVVARWPDPVQGLERGLWCGER